MERNFWEQGEADAWFKRNAPHLSKVYERTDLKDLLGFIELQKIKLSTVLEIGCSSGLLVQEIASRTGAKGFGVDLSELAVAEGRNRLKNSSANVELVVASGTNLPTGDREFDLVFAGFFLYAIPPSQLFRALAEIDRVLKDGGYLAILDFGFPHFVSVPYLHEAGARVYKRRYIDMLLNSHHYSLAFSRTYSESDPLFPVNPSSRLNFSILFKEPKPYLEIS